MASSKTRKRSGGFTLIEALVATLIVALALVAITTKVSLAAKIAKRTQEQTIARWVAMNAITELRLKPGLADTGRSDGDEEMAGTEWRWDMEILKSQAEDVHQVIVTVSHANTPDRSIYQMTSLVGNNTPGAAVRPWSGWPDTGDVGGGRNQPRLIPGAPVIPGQRPNPRRGIDDSRNR
ncbi:MAG: type II secretion system minor pseudopilin GspI [Gammaproteobacteria bacterium]